MCRKEQLGRRNHRLWHGTADPKAWEKGTAPFEWHPLSRRYAVAPSLRAGGQSGSQSAAAAPAAAPAPRQRRRHRSSSSTLPAASQPAWPSSASLPRPASVSFMPPGALPSRPAAAAASQVPGLAPRSILVGTLGHHVPAGYLPQAPAMPSFPPNPSEMARRASTTAAAVSCQLQPKSKKKAGKKRRRSKTASSSEEETSSPSEDSHSDSANSDTSQSAPHAVSVTHLTHHKHAKQQSAVSEAGVMSRQDEEEFYEALTKFWGRQGGGGKRILAKYQPFESMRLTSGMPTFGAHHYWAAVMAIGGHSMVQSNASCAVIITCAAIDGEERAQGPGGGGCQKREGDEAHCPGMNDQACSGHLLLLGVYSESRPERGISSTRVRLFYLFCRQMRQGLARSSALLWSGNLACCARAF